MGRWIGLALLLSTLPPAWSATWIVDASGAGDFLTIQAAIDAAGPGDVLLVQPGAYPAFVLDRELAILGVPSAYPAVAGKSTIVAGATTVAGLELGSLDVLAARGPVLLDDVIVNGELPGPVGCDGMLIQDCAQVHVTRSTIHGKDGDAFCESRGLRIEDSDVTLTGCTVVGGTGWGDDFTGYPGKEGLDVAGDSRVLLAHTSVHGGHGGSPEILFGGVGGDGAEAVRINWGEPAGPAVCTVRGNGASIVHGGFAGLGIGAQDAFASVTGWGTLVLSGVPTWPEDFGAVLTVQAPEPAEAFLHMVGGDLPLDFKRLNMYGPAGATLVLVGSLVPAKLESAAVDGTLWLDPGVTGLFVPVVLMGQELSANLAFQLPASLAGLEGLLLVVQGFAPGLGAGGTHLATNPEHLLLR